MKLGVLTVPLYDRSASEAFRWLRERGVETLELGTGGFPGTGHCNPGELLADAGKLNEFRALLQENDLEVSALSCHSNHVHPDPAVRERAAQGFTQALRLAEQLEVPTVVTFSGCPGDGEGARYPSWSPVAWPEDFQKLQDYQWNQVLIPFWRDAVQEAARYGVKQIALELHPGFCAYNPATLLRLREAVGPAIGATLDPSHLFWQGIDPVEAIGALGDAIYHFHAKDTKINRRNTEINGVLDTTSLANVRERSWVFRTVGYGHDMGVWKNIMSALQLNGYSGAVSIEHEDALLSVEEGLEKAISFVRQVLIREKPIEDVFWA